MIRADYQPLILIGAARSGTKMLRDLIAGHPRVARVPYDINFIWRLGNEELPHDEIPARGGTRAVRGRIRRFVRGSLTPGATCVVEKTVSNCLRVPFVASVFPEARYIHLIRDGRDVVESVYRQWSAPPDWSYILRKGRWFPLREASGYALGYALKLARRVGSDSAPVEAWGQRYEGIDEDLRARDLIEVCAIQWARSVEKASADLATIPPGRVLTVRYEEFVQAPLPHLHEISRFIGVDPDPYDQNERVGKVTTKHVGKGQRELAPELRALAEPWMARSLAHLDYR